MGAPSFIKRGGETLSNFWPREIHENHVFPGADVDSSEAGVGLPEPQPRTSDVSVSNRNQ